VTFGRLSSQAPLVIAGVRLVIVTLQCQYFLLVTSPDTDRLAMRLGSEFLIRSLLNIPP